jgi:sugar lactone lactonase YvrE
MGRKASAVITARPPALSYAGGMAVDSAGNLYMGDSGNNCVRKVSNGVITTVAGNGTQGFSADNGLASSAQLGNPTGVAVDSAANLYIADSENNRIRKVSDGVITTVAGNKVPGFSGDNCP